MSKKARSSRTGIHRSPTKSGPGRFGADGRWISAGYSNGGAWAIGAGQRRPDVFTGVAAFSAGVIPRQLTSKARDARIPHYLAAGRLETAFRGSVTEWAQRLHRAGLPYRHEEWAGGHDPFWWHQQLPLALAWLVS